MLRVGLTGGLGSGKSTVGRMLARRGASLLQADEIGRELMRPGQAVYDEIVALFGPGVVRADGGLDRGELARLAFREGRGEELNAIVHPAVIARQAEMSEEIGGRDPGAVVVVESALIFETRYGDGWRERFDVLVLVTAEEQIKVERYVARAAGTRPASELEAEARARLALQMRDEEKADFCDYVIANDGTLQELEAQAGRLWEGLLERSAAVADGEAGA